jgi:hypothetical protein
MKALSALILALAVAGCSNAQDKKVDAKRKADTKEADSPKQQPKLETSVSVPIHFELDVKPKDAISRLLEMGDSVGKQFGMEKPTEGQAMVLTSNLGISLKRFPMKVGGELQWASVVVVQAWLDAEQRKKMEDVLDGMSESIRKDVEFSDSELAKRRIQFASGFPDVWRTLSFWEGKAGTTKVHKSWELGVREPPK